MPRVPLGAASAALLLVATAAGARAAATTATDALCASVAGAAVPGADRPNATQQRELASCDGEALLYGIGRPADPERARFCALLQQERERPGSGELFSGSGLLMTIYANGLGVPRDLPLAAHLACSAIWSADAEREARVPHILGLAHASGDAARFSPCDDITSGAAAATCAAHDARLKNAQRDAVLAAFAKGLPPDALARFNALRAAEAHWADARATHEVDRGGTIAPSMQVDEESLQDADFADMVARLQQGPPPKLDAGSLRTADARMRDLLRRLLAGAAPTDPETLSPDDIRTAQRAWLAYRDAWGAFAAAAYPRWGAAGAEAWVTMKRADMLQHLLPAP
jgi:hypothetical protein